MVVVVVVEGKDRTDEAVVVVVDTDWQEMKKFVEAEEEGNNKALEGKVHKVIENMEGKPEHQRCC